MDPFNCRGLIIRSNEYKDKDRLLSVLTADRGLITICAKGVSKPGSSLGCFSMPYMLCDFVVSVSHGYYYLKDASIIESNSKIMDSLEQMTVAAHISSCLMDCTLQSENAKEAYELAVYAYYMLANNKDKYLLIYSAFNWRLLTIAGFTVLYDLDDPLYKASGDKQGRYMINISGGSESSQNRSFNRLLDEPAVRALNFFATCDLKRMFTSNADKKTEQDLKEFTTDYLSIHFDKIYDSLSVLNNL
ncbi:DNA replication and repair protein RecO [Ruminococcaceae bacterium YAD3003]|nr:DNA replication and repair protein RecO [Ruminococcaceae bacterium YAD3003]